MIEESQRLHKRILSLKDNAYQGKFILLNFLDDMTQNEIRKCFKSKENLKPYFYGGYSDSDYKRCIFKEAEPDINDYQIEILKINYSKRDYILNHRMILGSVLALGLKREIIGDIIENNGDYYLFVVKNMADFIIDNLHYVGKASVNLERSQIDFEIKKEYMENDYFISSLRLDVIISAFYNLSRKVSLELIKDGAVKVNHQVSYSQATTITPGDILSIKGKGRLIVDEIKGKTKSGNIIIKLKKPL